jgi:hypothetical protein
MERWLKETKDDEPWNNIGGQRTYRPDTPESGLSKAGYAAWLDIEKTLRDG